jgi:hypothetical protein
MDQHRKEFYPDAQEPTPRNMPEPALGNPVDTSAACVDANHAGYLTNERLYIDSCE